MTRYSNYHPQLFVDMNPKAKLYDGLFCALINGAAIAMLTAQIQILAPADNRACTLILKRATSK